MTCAKNSGRRAANDDCAHVLVEGHSVQSLVEQGQLHRAINQCLICITCQPVVLVSLSSHQFPSKCVLRPRSVEPEDDDAGAVPIEVLHYEIFPLLLGGVGLESLTVKCM